MSTPAYFGCVFLVTALLIAVIAYTRPSFATDLALWVGLQEPPQSEPDSFFDVRVAPLFEQRCVDCHGAIRRKGKLRLDSFAGTLRGGKHGSVVEAGNSEGSEIYNRLILPSDDEKAMPPKGSKSLSEDEITVVELWINYGASGELPAADIKEAPEMVEEVTFPEIDMAAVAEQRAPLAPMVRELQERFPGVISYMSRGSADLAVNGSLLGATFDDEALSSMAPISERIVWLNLSRTGITGASGSTLATMGNLRFLRLSNTEITDKTIAALASLPALESLSVIGTGVTTKGLIPLRAKGIMIYADNIEMVAIGAN